MTDKINDFLQEQHLKIRSQGTWGIGTVLVRAGAKAALATMSVHSATDQFLISTNREVALPIIAETLGKTIAETLGTMMSPTLKDPSLFDIPTATFAVLIERYLLGVKQGVLSLVFVTLKAVSEGSTHILIEGYQKGYFPRAASVEVKRVRDQISARFR